MTSLILRYRNFSSIFRAFAIAVNFFKYEFYSSLILNVAEKVSTLESLYIDACIFITSSISIIPFRAELFTAMCIVLSVFVCFFVVLLFSRR